MADITVHEIVYGPPKQLTSFTGKDSPASWRVVCTSQQARNIAEQIEKIGWIVLQITRIPAMSLEDVVKELQGLELIAKLSAPSPFNENGSLTEAAKTAIRAGEFTAEQYGKRINPDEEPST
jgi:hypothetical protein